MSDEHLYHSDRQAEAARDLHCHSVSAARTWAKPEELVAATLAGMGRVIAATLTAHEMRALAANLDREACLREAMDWSGK